MFFSELEKRIINHIVSLPVNNRNLAYSLRDILLNDRYILFRRGRDSLALGCVSGSINDFMDELFTFVSLIDFLEKNNYIYIDSFPNAGPVEFLTSNLVFETVAGNANYTHSEIDTNTYFTIKGYLDSYIHPCSSLRALVENNYFTPEQLRHNEQMKESRLQTKWSRWAFCVALGAFVIALITSWPASPMTL